MRRGQPARREHAACDAGGWCSCSAMGFASARRLLACLLVAALCGPAAVAGQQNASSDGACSPAGPADLCHQLGMMQFMLSRLRSVCGLALLP